MLKPTLRVAKLMITRNIQKHKNCPARRAVFAIPIGLVRVQSSCCMDPLWSKLCVCASLLIWLCMSVSGHLSSGTICAWFDLRLPRWVWVLALLWASLPEVLATMACADLILHLILINRNDWWWIWDILGLTRSVTCVFLVPLLCLEKWGSLQLAKTTNTTTVSHEMLQETQRIKTITMHLHFWNARRLWMKKAHLRRDPNGVYLFSFWDCCCTERHTRTNAVLGFPTKCILVFFLNLRVGSLKKSGQGRAHKNYALVKCPVLSACSSSNSSSPPTRFRRLSWPDLTRSLLIPQKNIQGWMPCSM